MRAIIPVIILLFVIGLTYLAISGFSQKRQVNPKVLQLRCMKGDTSGVCEAFKEGLEKCLREEYTLQVVYVPRSYLIFDGRLVPYAIKEEGAGVFPAPSLEYACKRWEG